MKKPGDETVPHPAGGSKDGLGTVRSPSTSGVHRSLTAEQAKLKRPGDSFAVPRTVSGIQRPVTGEMAPEASQGAWRERAFTPRATMTKDEVLAGLSSALRFAVGQASPPRVAFDALRKDWRPLLRQALEQAGGDGLDAWLGATFSPPGRKPLDPLLAELIKGLGRLRAAKDLPSFDAEAQRLVATVRTALAQPKPRRLSFKVLEKELEGKLDVDELLHVFTCDEPELHRRLKELGATMDNLRSQIVDRPGKQPDGMYANFVRLKAEARLIDAELKRRRQAPRGG